MNETQGCSEVSMLNAKIESLHDKQEDLKGLVNEIKSILKAQNENLQKQIVDIATKTAQQEVRLTVVENNAQQQEGRLGKMEGTVMTHSTRIAQWAIGAIMASLILPVVVGKVLDNYWENNNRTQAIVSYERVVA